MVPRARVFGTDGQEIFDPASWRVHAHPENPEVEWKPGYSAMEQANAWLRTGKPATPEEFWAAIADLAANADEIYARPEHRTKLDNYRRRRQHDLFGCTRRKGKTTLVFGVEAKACEDFAGTVAQHAKPGKPSKARDRCNLLARALFGRDVVDQESGDILDARLSNHGYQLWTAAVGTIIEAQKRGKDEAVLVIHQLRPRVLSQGAFAGDPRNWSVALDTHKTLVGAFAADLAAAGGASHKTAFVKAGANLHVRMVETTFP
jgi:hypothetical protein